MILLWSIIFLVSLAVLVKGADWLLESAEKIGLALGLSPFVVGIIIVGIGTSLPELISSLAATFKGVTDIVSANAIGSNVANILLIVGISALVGKRLTISRNIIDLDLPLLGITTAIFLAAAMDGIITTPESILLLISYGIYLHSTISHNEEDETREEQKKAVKKYIDPEVATHTRKPKTQAKDFVFLALGIAGLVFGAKYLIDAVVVLSKLFNIGTEVIAISAVALGTSLPELLVSAKAARRGKSEVALGNILGSNMFNVLVVIGLPGLFGTLMVNEATLNIGIPALIVATLLFIISGISRRFHVWDGALSLILYLLFIGKLFALF